ncbi:MAG: T9SS type A sorting domain-containing protein, partial [Pseudomonadota bacterium]
GFNVDGTYIIKVWINLSGDANQANDTAILTITNLANPVVSIIANPTSGAAPLTVNYNVSTTAIGYSLDWNFPGGSPASSSDLSPSIVYQNTGTYNVGLNLTINGTNCTASDSSTAIVSVISSVNNLKDEKFFISPNPATDFILINSDKQITLVEIYNVVGQKIITQLPTMNENNVRVNTHYLNSGVYFVRVICSDSIREKKILIGSK